MTKLHQFENNYKDIKVLKRNQIEIIELRGIIIEMKNAL